MDGSLKLFRIFGITIYLHFSWWLVFVLLSWSLATAFFPAAFPGYNPYLYWFMGITAAVLLFISVLLHELSHSFVAKLRRIKVENITLFFFGGVAGISDEDMSPLAEFQMALAGPIFSLLLSGLFFVLYSLNGHFFLTAITLYLYQVNLVLALFNLVPGFPLDGGRAFRAVLNWYYHDLRKATKIAAGVGKIVAGILIAFGFLGFFTATGGGLWFILLGVFLYFIAGASYEQVVVRMVLSKVPLRELMERTVVKVPGSMTLEQLVRSNAKSGEDVFVVLSGKAGVPKGIVDIRLLGKMSAALRQTPLKQLAVPISTLPSVSPRDSAYAAFRESASRGMELLPLRENGKVVGYVRRSMLMHRLMWELKFGKAE